MNPLTKIGCFIIGWNYKILSGCSEASYKALKKYTSALLILVIIWAFIGYSFAQRYVGAPVWGCIVTSLIFVIVVIQIERQIILMVGHNNWVAAFRIALAIIMALLGSTIIDQIVFGTDVDKKRVELIGEEVNRLAPVRQREIQLEIDRFNAEIDSLENKNIFLSDEIAKNPTIYAFNTINTETPVLQEDGTYKNIESKTTSRTSQPNPRIQELESNSTRLAEMRVRLNELTDSKLKVSAEIKEELEKNKGFLEELRALYQIIKSDWIALAFYIILFCFFFSLELLVLTSKLGDKKCDYDLIVMHQLQIKTDALNELVNKS